MIKPEYAITANGRQLDARTITDSYVKAVNVNRSIIIHAQAAQAELYEVCKGLKEMRDGKLYKELGYQNFEEYCETEVGIRRNQAYKYISVVENLDGDFVSSRIQNAGVQKLYLLSTLSESDREELTDRVDIESTTTRQLKAEIDQLKAEKAQQADELQDVYSNRDRLREQVTELEQQVQELESRPIEVAAVSESHEVENMRLAMNKNSAEWSKRYDELQEENLAHERQLHQTYRQQMDSLREEYEQKLAQVDCSDYDAMMETYITCVTDAVGSAVRHIIGMGFSLNKLQLALEGELRTIQKLEQEESEKYEHTI